MDAQALHLILNGPGPDIPLSDYAKVVRCAPDASPVVGRRDGSVREVDDLVAVLEVADDLRLTGDESVRLLVLILGVIG